VKHKRYKSNDSFVHKLRDLPYCTKSVSIEAQKTEDLKSFMVPYKSDSLHQWVIISTVLVGIIQNAAFKIILETSYTTKTGTSKIKYSNKNKKTLSH